MLLGGWGIVNLLMMIFVIANMEGNETHGVSVNMPEKKWISIHMHIYIYICIIERERDT